MMTFTTPRSPVRSLSLPSADKRLTTIRRQETATALTRLGGLPADLRFIGAPDGTLVARPEIVAKVGSLARACGAGVLLAPSPLDPHCDHVAGAQIGRMAAELLGNVQLGFYPVWSRWQLDHASLGASAYAGIYLQDPKAVEPIFVGHEANSSTGCCAAMSARADSEIGSLENMQGKSLAYADPNAASG